MFVLKTKYSTQNHYFNDISTLADVVIGLTNNETEAKRIADIAGHMKFGDGFATDGMLLVCEKEEDVHAC